MSIRAYSWLVLLLVAAGCNTLPAGRLAPPPPGTHVYLIRGWRDLYSGGVDDLAARLRAAGVAAEVYKEDQHAALADALASAPPRPLVLIGFSYGADDAVRIARRAPVDLLATIDPVTPNPLPATVRRAVNYYQSNGPADAVPFLRGVPLEVGRAASVTNYDLRRDRRELLEPGTSHATIAGNGKVHEEVVREVIQVVGRER